MLWEFMLFHIINFYIYTYFNIEQIFFIKIYEQIYHNVLYNPQKLFIMKKKK